NCQQDGHGADHEGGVADGGAGKTVKLDEELDGNAEGCRDEKGANFTCSEADAVEKGDGQHSHAGKQEAVEHHVLDTHFIEGKSAEVKSGAPQASGNSAGAVAEEGYARAERS